MNVVSGAFGYIGKYIARHLLDRGEPVRTITTRPRRPDPFGGEVEAFPYSFDRPEDLVASLRGATALYNTYWIRFEYGGATFRQAISNSATLFECARRAGVRKIVHVSVSNASLDSPLPYFRGKAAVEEALIDSGVPYSILRPTLVFGRDDLLVNNMAWLMRRFPVFPIFGSGSYRLTPIHAEDLARAAVAAAGTEEWTRLDAIGPETFTFAEFARHLAEAVRPGPRFVRVPPAVGLALGRVIGLAVRDVLLTRDELRGLMDGLLTSSQPPNGTTRFSEWVVANADDLGRVYVSELAKHFR